MLMSSSVFGYIYICCESHSLPACTWDGSLQIYGVEPAEANVLNGGKPGIQELAPYLSKPWMVYILSVNYLQDLTSSLETE